MSIQTEINKSFAILQELRFTAARGDRHRSWPRIALILILVVEFGVLLLRARSKLFWYDELITFHISGLQPLSRLQYALSSGADSMSLGYYLVIRLARMLPIDPLIAMRVPSILGYLLSLLGVYWFVTRKLPEVAGLTAVLLMTLSSLRWYATEARAYALLVGLLAVAVALWQRIGERRFATPVFGASLICAVASYPLAALAIACFAAAELAVIIRERRIRSGVWLAFAIATAPFLASLRTFAHLRDLYSAHFWARTSWDALITASAEYLDLGPRMTPVLVIFCLLAIVRMLRTVPANRGKSRQEFVLPDLVLAGACLAYPALLVVVMKTTGSGYTSRYGLPGVLGLIPAIIYICRSQLTEKIFHRMTLALALTFALQMAHDFVARVSPAKQAEDGRWAELARIAHEQPGLPIVIASSHDFFEASEYGSADLKLRTVNLADKAASYKLLGSDSADIEDLILTQFFPVHFQPAGPFLAGEPRFVLQSGDQEDWLTRYLLDRRYRLSLVATDAAGPVYIAER